MPHHKSATEDDSRGSDPDRGVFMLLLDADLNIHFLISCK